MPKPKQKKAGKKPPAKLLSEAEAKKIAKAIPKSVKKKLKMHW